MNNGTNPARDVDLAELEGVARRIRFKVIELSHKAGTPHLGSSLSCVDIVTAAFWGGVLAIDPKNPSDPNRDRFLLSKGHAATTLYTALAYRGFYPPEVVDTYMDPGSCLAEQPSPGCVPGVEVATGSLGHGLSIGVGMALAGRIQGRSYRVFVVLSDGECNEGAVWEAAMLAPAHRLDNVVVVVDYNKWQATGRSNEIMALHPLKQKWEAFGWSAADIDGHDLNALVQALRKVPDGTGKPIALIAHTVKGKGIPFMEDDNNWHYRSPDANEVQTSKTLLGIL
jgi:transketolase